MRAIERQAGPADASRRARVLTAFGANPRLRPIAAVAALLAIAALGAFATSGLGRAERRVLRLHETASTSYGAAGRASDIFARLRATEARRGQAADRDGRSARDGQATNLQATALQHSLISELGVMLGRDTPLRTGQAAAQVRDAILLWLESAQAASDDADAGQAERDRRAAIVADKFALLTAALNADAAAARTGMAETLTEQRRLAAGAVAAMLLLAALAARLAARRRDGSVEAAAGVRAPFPEPDAVPDAGHAIMTGRIETAEAQASRLGAENRTLQAALDEMSQGLCLYDTDRKLSVANRRYGEIYRLEPGSIRAGMSALDVLECSIAAGNHPGRTMADLLAETGRPFVEDEQAPYIQELGDGRAIQIRGRITGDGKIVATYEDVTERWHAEARIAHMARHDTLTQLPNRVLLGERIEGAITQASRDSGFAVFCLDLDNFKQVNDTLGHAVGDELLRAVAHRLAACLREVDTVARLGGDEFAIVQAGVEGPNDAIILARRVIDVVSAPYDLTDHAVTVGVSIGIALAPRDGLAADRLMKNADVALYRAKGEGRGTFRFFETEMDARLQARRLFEIDLRAAVAEEAFELYYQPIYDLRQNRICGFEALLRWNHPTRGRVSPVEFIPLAEEIGLIVPLGEWVMRRACAQASLWPDELKVAVNVSPAQFQSAQLIDVVRSSLAQSGLPARRLELEITESVLLVNGNATIAILHALRTIGARISMDDFGTGYSSLSYLRSFPFDKMKIDKSFIRDLALEIGSDFIVRTVISLGSSLGMTMTAEGVETEEQLARLREEGCDEVQGFLFSPPVPAAQVPALLTKWNEGARAAA